MQKIKKKNFQFSFSNNFLPSKWNYFYHCFFFVGSSLLEIIHFIDNFFFIRSEIICINLTANNSIEYLLEKLNALDWPKLIWFTHKFPTKYRILKNNSTKSRISFCNEMQVPRFRKKIRSKIALVRSTSVLPSTLKDHKVNQYLIDHCLLYADQSMRQKIDCFICIWK